MDEAQVIRALLDFAEGRMEPREFEALLRNSDSPHFEEVLRAPIQGYKFILRQNFSTPAGVLNAHGALCRQLKEKGYDIQPTDSYQKFFVLLMRAQPSWLDVPLDYMNQHILPALGDLNRRDLKAALRRELLTRFRFENRPPRWVQGVEWPINENGPLVFVSQTKPDPKAHGLVIYTFRDEASGEIETLSQCL